MALKNLRKGEVAKRAGVDNWTASMIFGGRAMFPHAFEKIVKVVKAAATPREEAQRDAR